MLTTDNTNVDFQDAYDAAETKRRIAAVSSGFSLVLTPFLPFMAVPAGIGAYKAHKYKKVKRELQLHLPDTHQSSPLGEDFNADVRQVTRHVGRNSLGLLISGALAPVLPHMILPMGVNVYLLKKAYRESEKLAQVMENKGYRVRKRDVAQGVVRVCIEKAIIVLLALGHDDLVLAISSAAIDPSSSLLSASHGALVDAPGVEQFNKMVNGPVEGVQEHMEVQTSENRLDDVKIGLPDTGGWHESPELLVENIVIGGATAAAIEYTLNRPLEHKDDNPMRTPQL